MPQAKAKSVIPCKPATKKPSTQDASTKKPSQKPFTKKPSTKKPPAKKPFTKKPTTVKPPAVSKKSESSKEPSTLICPFYMVEEDCEGYEDLKDEWMIEFLDWCYLPSDKKDDLHDLLEHAREPRSKKKKGWSGDCEGSEDEIRAGLDGWEYMSLAGRSA